MNKIHLASRAVQAGYRRLGSPYKVNYITTWRCDSFCSHCRIWQRKSGYEMTPEEVRRIFTNIPNLSWVDVSGGEIFQREDIVEIFAAILESSPRLAMLHFPTSGSQPDRILECTRKILEMNPPKLTVTVSLDGPAEVHDRQRGKIGAFDRAIETYCRLRELPGCKTFLGMTLSRENRDLYMATIEAARLRAPWITPGDLHVNLFNASEHYYGNGGTSRKAGPEFIEVINTVLEARGPALSPYALFEKRYLQLAPQFLITGRSPVPCQALSATCFLSPEGTVYPCVTWDRALGNLRECGYDIARVWETSRIAGTRLAITRGQCPGCWTPCEAFPALGGDIRRLLVPKIGHASWDHRMKPADLR